jgi:hypothetical protein
MIAPEPPPTPQTVITRTPYSLVHSLTPGRDYPSLLTPLVHLLPPSPADAPLTLTIWTEDNAFRIPSERGGDWVSRITPRYHGFGSLGSALLGLALLRLSLPLRGLLEPPIHGLFHYYFRLILRQSTAARQR